MAQSPRTELKERRNRTEGKVMTMDAYVEVGPGVCPISYACKNKETKGAR